MIEKDHKNPSETLLRLRKNRPLDYVSTSSWDLTKEEMAVLHTLNKKLTVMEKLIVKELKEQIGHALKKIADKDDWINDFECTVEITFHLGEDDPDYIEDDDNDLMTMCDYFHSRPSMYDQYINGVNHNEFINPEYYTGHPMYGDFHCWTFYSLYDHTQLTFDEILRIKDIDISIIMELQHLPLEQLA